jgi:hypothetical protein
MQKTSNKNAIVGLIAAFAALAGAASVGAEERADIRIFACRGEMPAGSQAAIHKTGDEMRFLVSEFPRDGPMKKIVLVAYRVEVGPTQIRLRGNALRGKEYAPDKVDDVTVPMGKSTVAIVTGDAGERVALTIEAYRDGSQPPTFGPRPKCPPAT